MAGEEDDLTGGSVATEGQFPSTLYVRNGCTASKVGPKHILTAAHCIVYDTDGSIRYGYQSPFDVSNKVVTDNIAEDFPWIRVTPVKTHFPPVVEAAINRGERIWSWGEFADIAIVEVDNESAEKLASIPTATLDTDELKADDDVVIQGYGCENGFAGPKDYTKARLKFQPTKVTTLSVLNNESASAEDAGVPSLYLSSRDQRQFFVTRGQYRRREEASLCPGDSGGPVYRGGSTTRIVGVNSRGTKGPDANETGTTNMHTRLDPKTQWDVAGWLRTIDGLAISGAAGVVKHFDNCKTMNGGSGQPFKVCGAMLAAYEAGGGVAQLGIPTDSAGLEEHTELGMRWTQRFEYAALREQADGSGAVFVDKFGSRCEGKRVGGWYCGSSLSDSNPKHLYQCTAGDIPALTVCENGCRSMPSGVPDKCKDAAPARDLCAGARRTGMYCARNFDSGNGKTLLRCENQRTVRSVECARGCKGMPSGVPDKCND